MTSPNQTRSAQQRPARRNRNAKRSSLACVGCKKTKRRCDISEQPTESPGCTNCREKQECCEVRYGEDRRRKRATRKDSDLESRLASLESLIAQQRSTGPGGGSPTTTRTLPEPAIEAPRHTREERSLAVDDGISSRISRLENLAHVNETIHSPRVIDPPASPQLGTMEFISGASPNASVHPASVHKSPDNNFTRRPSAMVEDSGSIIEKMTSGEGNLDGHSPQNIRYFGPTSIYHLSTAPRSREANGERSSEHNLYSDSQEPWSNVPADCDPSNEPEALVLYLVDLFCEWQAPHLQIFDRDLFFKEKKLYDTDCPRGRYEFFSPSLLYAIMALAAMVTLDRGTRYHSTRAGHAPGSIYQEKARRLFELEMKDPSNTTVQTALLIGSYYGASGSSSQGWTFSGIAIRMAIELGLHISCDAAVRQGKLSSEVARVRQLIFWGCYVQDKLWSAYCGRPSFIMDWDITVSLPEKPSALLCSEPDQAAYQAAVHWNIILLTIQCSKTMSDLYSQKHGGNRQKLKSAATDIHMDLLKWHDNLPKFLRWPNESGSPVSPHILVMQMQFYFTLILLHRPFINFNEDVMSFMQADGMPSTPISICNLAATNIAKLSRDYSFSYSLRQIPSPSIHFVFTAATIHLINHRVGGEGNDGNHEFWFQGCLSSLAEIGEAYPNGQRAVSVLQDLWQQLQPTQNVSGRGENADTSASEAMMLQRTSPNSLQAHMPDYRNAQSHETALIDPNLPPPAQDNSHWASWNTDFRNFDWSNLNSPITFPAELEDIDLTMDNNITQPISRELNSGSRGFGMGPVTSAVQIPGMESNEFLGFNTVLDMGSSEDTQAMFLSRNYGTSIGLGRSS